MGRLHKKTGAIHNEMAGVPPFIEKEHVEGGQLGAAVCVYIQNGRTNLEAHFRNGRGE